MISEYHRPETLEKALELLGRKSPNTIPLGGGTAFPHNLAEKLAVVDLQGLGMNQIRHEGAFISAGSMTKLQVLFEADDIPEALARSIQLEAPLNRREIATIGGTVIASEGRSLITTVLLAMDALLVWEPANQQVSLGDWLASRDGIRRGEIKPPGFILTAVKWSAKLTVSLHSVSRTPLDLPILCVAAAGWGSGRRRIALGGFGRSAVLVIDGPEPGGAEQAVRAATNNASDEWASAAYRQEIGWTLTKRCLFDLENGK